MSVHPIEFRYYSKEMRALFTEEAKLQNWLTVEAALATAHAKLNHIPQKAAKEISEKANTQFVKLERVKAIEEEIHHDLMAMVKALTELCSEEAGKFVHLGATSYDIEDTALALQLSAALDVLKKVLLNTLSELCNLAERNKKLVCAGRTHGQHAVPTTMGLKFGIYACEFARHLERLNEAYKRIKVGKMTGAVGTQASFGADARRLQNLVMEQLGISPVLLANQVVQRDRHSEVIFLLSLIAASAEKIAKEIRNLQRTEIGEIYESFSKKQVGSSTMPQKRNPHKSERICSIARIIRSYIAPSLENISLEHERDLTNSAAERIIFPEAFILTDYMLRQLNEILSTLVIREDNVKRNLELTGGLIMSERIMIALVEKGIGRQEAHELVRISAHEAFTKGKKLLDILIANEKISKVFSREDLQKCFEEANYIGTAVEQVDDALLYLHKFLDKQKNS
jgi:adenylosuccinate lyase